MSFRLPRALSRLAAPRLAWLPLVVFVAALALGAALIAQIEQARVQQRRAIALDRAIDHGQALQMQISRTLSATYALAAVLRQGQGRIDGFAALAAEMLPLYPGISGLALAPGGVVSQIAPYAGNEGAIGIDILNDPLRRPEAMAALRSRRVTLAGPLPLSNGGAGLIGRLAIFLGQGEQARFWGFVTAAIRLDELLRAGHLEQMRDVGYAYELVRSAAGSGEPLVLGRSAVGRLDNPVVHLIEVPNGQWVLRIAPIGGWHSYPSLAVEALLAVLASALLAYLTHALLRQPRLLQTQVELRTRELAAANRRLTTLYRAVEQSPTTVMITDRAGRIEYVNPRFTELTGYTAAEAIGQRPSLVQSGLTAEAIYAELWRTVNAGGTWRGEVCNRKKSGELFWEAEEIAPVKDEHGEITHFVVVKEDVTERRQAREALKALNRTLRVISQGNAALVRAGDEASLLGEVGRILVDVGGYCAVWIGLPDAGTRLRPVTIVPAAVLAPEHLAVDRGAAERWPGFVGEALASGRPVLSLKVGEDPFYRAAAAPIAACACQAAAALPLVFAGETLGVLVLHTRDEKPFAEAEIALLQELADDLAYGLAALRRQEALRLRERAIEAVSNGIMISAASLPDHPFTYVNPAFERITGISAAEAIGRNGRFLLGDDTDQAGLEEIRLALREGRDGRAVLYHHRQDGSIVWAELSVSPVRNRDGQISHFVSVINDISERKRYEQQLEHQANHDDLTGLPNRNLLADRLEQAIVRAGRDGEEVAVMIVDLDHFKVINDSLGHSAGDGVLRSAAGRLQACVRDGDTLARLGGDEFVLVLPASDATRVAEVVRGRLQAALATPFMVEGKALTLSASVGVSLFPRDASDRQALIKHADAAMYRVKEQGRNGCQFFTAEINQRANERLSMESQLRRALENGELLLHYHPQVDLNSGAVVGAEALVRWQHPELGLVPPLRFIPLAEETGLIVPLGEWVLWAACRQNQAWLEQGLAAGRVAVNLSARQFADVDLLALARRVLDETRLPPALLELELTESLAMRGVDKAAKLVLDLKRLGVRTSLDDFGTGHSSLNYLKRFAVNSLKIDRSFVHDIAVDPHNAAIATTIIAMAHALGLKVIAEGVETEAELRYLHRHRCDEIQGFYYSKPLPAGDYEALLRAPRRLELPAGDDGGQARTLLLVDDEPNVLTALQRLFRRDGYRILLANSAREGLDLLALNPVQVILSDQRMPEMSGTEFLSRVKQLHPQTVRMVLSGYTDLDTVTGAINEGAIYKFLTKPWDGEALRETVQVAFRVYEQGGQGPGLQPPATNP